MVWCRLFLLRRSDESLHSEHDVEPRCRRRAAFLSLETKALVVDPDGKHPIVVGFVADLRLCLGYRTVYIYIVLR